MLFFLLPNVHAGYAGRKLMDASEIGQPGCGTTFQLEQARELYDMELRLEIADYEVYR